MAHQEIRGKIYSYVRQHGGSDDEGISIFHDTVVAFVKYVFQNRNFRLTDSLVGYMRTIGKYQWINQLRKINKSVPVSSVDTETLSIPDSFQSDHFILNKEKLQSLTRVLDKLASRCKEVLMYWSSGYSMKEVAKMVDYQSEGMARKKKSQCMKSLYEIISENPNIKEQLRN